VTASFSQVVVDGLKVTLAGTAPDLQNSGKVRSLGAPGSEGDLRRCRRVQHPRPRLVASHALSAPGLAACAFAALGFTRGPTPSSRPPAHVTLDYLHPYFTSKASCSLNKAPKLDVSAAAGHNGFVVGGEALVDLTRSAILNWNAAVSFVGTEFTVTGHMLNGTDTLKGTYFQRVDLASSIGAEVVQTLSTGKVAVVLGYSNTALNGA